MRNITVNDMCDFFGFNFFAIICGLLCWGGVSSFMRATKELSCSDCVCLSEAMYCLGFILFGAGTLIFLGMAFYALLSEEGLNCTKVEKKQKKEKPIKHKFKVGDKIVGNNKSIEENEICITGNGYGIVAKVDDDGGLDVHWWDKKKDKEIYEELNPDCFDLFKKRSKKKGKKK